MLTATKQAVLLFARSPNSESRAKRSLAGRPAALRRVHELLLQRTFQKLSTLPTEIDLVLSIDEPASVAALASRMLAGHHVKIIRQEGASPEERLRAAVSYVESQGYLSLAVIGVDTPGLSAQHLSDALSLAAAGQLVLGPALDGGFYLLAGHSPLSSILTSLSFGKSAASAVIAAAALAHKEVTLLEPLSDLDTARDVVRIKVTLLEQRDYLLLHALSALQLAENVSYSTETIPAPYIELFLSLLLRSPPHGLLRAA
jgi:glycosyltransferase A (GT-A) superfamily protein (DUF2064 family)